MLLLNKNLYFKKPTKMTYLYTKGSTTVSTATDCEICYLWKIFIFLRMYILQSLAVATVKGQLQKSNLCSSTGTPYTQAQAMSRLGNKRALAQQLTADGCLQLYIIISKTNAKPMQTKCKTNLKKKPFVV
ncbi:hypothetical protein XELAEV_18029316mg [Xenopus laevis]|uniref:Uncharacterized protein n=1 Tax=Xenopus laevis TaxID=8355 RepID=A0A974CR35_XENLA|nr:hypothetical protein XELAEV_18029316mg [Xenopus laevis]